MSRRSKATAAPAAKEDPHFPRRAKNFRIGGDVQPTRDLSRFVRWPRYIRIQRQRKVLCQRLKVPPAIQQFKRGLDKNHSAQVFKLFAKYTPETKTEKRARRAAAAEAKAANKDFSSERPNTAQFGINHVTHLIEENKAELVLIAGDVDPIELVVWLPALCRRKGVPYMIVNNKGRLGTLVNQKKATAVCLHRDQINKEDRSTVESLKTQALEDFNNATDVLKTWGGGQMGLKTVKRLEIRDRIMRAEAEKKAKY